MNKLEKLMNLEDLVIGETWSPHCQTKVVWLGVCSNVDDNRQLDAPVIEVAM